MSPQKAKILVVDDDRQTVEFLVTLLKDHDYIPKFIVRSEFLFPILQSDQFDLILLDIHMPGVSGLNLLQDLKRHPQFGKIPVIMLTGDISEQLVAQSFSIGASDFVNKPIHSAVLLARIQALLTAHWNRINLEQMVDQRTVELKKTIIELEEETLRRMRHENELNQTRLILEEKFRELELSHAQIHSQQSRMLEELQLARETQKVILPQEFPQIPNIHFAHKYETTDLIGGDFYDVFQMDDQKVGLVIGDVMGHGISASLLAFTFLFTFSYARQSGESTARAISLTNSYIKEKLKNHKFACMTYALLDPSGNTLTYTNAGTPANLWIRPQQGKIEFLKTHGTVVGTFSYPLAEYEEQTIQMVPGDKFIMFTDALTETLNHKNEMLHPYQIRNKLLPHIEKPVEQIIEQLYGIGREHSTTGRYEDDLTILGLEIL
ncbi:MAG: SpoIIE family protein phosphatase [SAR324 cluster bacterium]|nr:SpoIIE family protein phosphatase [SAR324 cluster bacterium]